MDNLTNITNERRVGSFESAYSIFTKLKKENRERENAFALIENQLGGGRPFDPAKLAETGQSWRCNVNFGDAASALEQALVSYWRLLHDTTDLLAVEIHDDHPDRDRWAQTLQYNYNRFIEDWGDEYVRNYLLFSRNHLVTGVGSVLFRDMDSPRWEVIRTGGVLVPNRALASSSKQEMVCIEQELTISDLWEKIRTPQAVKASALRGWQEKPIRELLYRALNRGQESRSDTDLLKIEDDIRNKSFQLSAENGPIQVFHMFVQEWDGKVTHLIMATDRQDVGFLFDDHHTAFRAKAMSEAIALVFFEVGNGLFHGVRGFGHKNYQTSNIQNRLKNRMVDRTMVEGLNFKDKGEGNRSTIPITQMGGFNILPNDLEQIPSYPGTSSIPNALAMVQDTISWNNARYRDQSQQVANTETATQARILANLQSQVDVSNATLYLKQFAKNIMAVQLTRMMRQGNTDGDAKLFRERCLKDGAIPKEAFHGMELTVRTGADPGKSSASVQFEMANTLLQLQGNPYIDRHAATEALVEYGAGTGSVKRFVKPEDQLEDSGSQRLAILENTSLGDGIPVPAVQGDNHPEHIQVHMEPLLGMVGNAQMMDEGMIGMPTNADMPTQPSLSQEQMIALETTLPHIAQHLEFLKLDPFQEAVYQQLHAQFKELEATAGGMIRKIEETALAYANQQQFGQLNPDIPAEGTTELQNNEIIQEPIPQAPAAAPNPTDPA